MFTWINKAAFFALLSVLSVLSVLAGCQGLPGGMIAPPGQTRALAVLDGAITVAAPAGYCVDKQSARQQDDGAVVLIGRCNGRSNAPPAVITVTLGIAGSAGAMAGGGAALSAFFRSETGRAALSRTGNAQRVQILSASEIDGAFLMKITDSGTAPYWRAVLGLSGRLTTLSVQGATGAQLDAAAGRRLLDAMIRSLRAANRPATPNAAAAASRTASG